MRQYEAEQRDIAEIKDFIARFGHGSAKMVRQAQSREKLLEKKLADGLTELPEQTQLWDWNFPDAGSLPVPVLAIERLSFAYPNSDPLYDEVDFGIDLQTRVALVGPNGAVRIVIFGCNILKFILVVHVLPHSTIYTIVYIYREKQPCLKLSATNLPPQREL